MISAKKKWYLVVLVLLVFFVWCIGRKDENSKGSFLHKDFYGTIVSYEETDSGLTFVLDNDATTSDRVFIITDDTMFENDVLQQRLLSREEQLYVEIASEYYTGDVEPWGVYPATAIYYAK